jgi:large subunit ribosomal protein L31
MISGKINRKKWLQTILIYVNMCLAVYRHCIRERGETAMKENIHPQYGKCVVRCVCGETFETGSTKKEMKVDICSKCHPFYTGKQKLVDTGGRVDRFKKRFNIE